MWIIMNSDVLFIIRVAQSQKKLINRIHGAINVQIRRDDFLKKH